MSQQNQSNQMVTLLFSVVGGVLLLGLLGGVVIFGISSTSGSEDDYYPATPVPAPGTDSGATNFKKTIPVEINTAPSVDATGAHQHFDSDKDSTGKGPRQVLLDFHENAKHKRFEVVADYVDHTSRGGKEMIAFFDAMHVYFEQQKELEQALTDKFKKRFAQRFVNDETYSYRFDIDYDMEVYAVSNINGMEAKLLVRESKSNLRGEYYLNMVNGRWLVDMTRGTMANTLEEYAMLGRLLRHRNYQNRDLIDNVIPGSNTSTAFMNATKDLYHNVASFKAWEKTEEGVAFTEGPGAIPGLEKQEGTQSITAHTPSVRVLEAPWIQDDYYTAVSKAKAERKDLLIFFTGSDWCVPCQSIKKNIFSEKEFTDFAQKEFVLLVLDYPRTIQQPDVVKETNRRLAQEHDIQSYPTVKLINFENDHVYGIYSGYSTGSPQDYIDRYSRALKKHRPDKPEPVVYQDGQAVNASESLLDAYSEIESATKHTPLRSVLDGPWIQDDYYSAEAIAKAEGKDLLIFFTGSDWCGPCKALKRDVFSKEAFVDYAKENYVLLVLDHPRQYKQPDIVKKTNHEMNTKHQVRGFPTVKLVNMDSGKAYGSYVGYYRGGPDAYMKMIERDRKKR